jgi:hypothetical protein
VRDGGEDRLGGARKQRAGDGAERRAEHQEEGDDGESGGQFADVPPGVGTETRLHIRAEESSEQNRSASPPNPGERTTPERKVI